MENSLSVSELVNTVLFPSVDFDEVAKRAVQEDYLNNRNRTLIQSQGSNDTDGQAGCLTNA